MIDKRKLVLNAKQLRKGLPTTDYGLQKLRKSVDRRRNAIYIVLDNVLDTYNIGSIFRLADAVAAKKIYLCGGTETPPNHRIKKASINTTEVVEWEYYASASEAISKLKSQNSNLQVIAIEQVEESVQYDKFEYKLPLALVVGHETSGVSPEVLKIVDGVVELPMFGVNKSLNVMVSLAIVLYEVIERTISK
ncbi:MAG: TrmH family RNA methyltransferase [Candidatus Daviesbacteria bacterium]|nr:MAG: TrmH family RNA methyltransferase [Candidatus Daviesbacteria bacterium]